VAHSDCLVILHTSAHCLLKANLQHLYMYEFKHLELAFYNDGPKFVMPVMCRQIIYV